MRDASYRSFVVRIWERDSALGGTRVEIEQMQSGAKVVLRDGPAERVASLIEASSTGTERVPVVNREDAS